MFEFLHLLFLFGSVFLTLTQIYLVEALLTLLERLLLETTSLADLVLVLVLGLFEVLAFFDTGCFLVTSGVPIREGNLS